MLPLRLGLRQSDRHEVALSADFELPWGRIRRVELTDLSTSGCRIAAPDPLLAVGDTVLIRTSALSGAIGTVRWCKEGEAGIAFASLLDDRLLAQLANFGSPGAKMIVARPQVVAACPA